MTSFSSLFARQCYVHKVLSRKQIWIQQPVWEFTVSASASAKFERMKESLLSGYGNGWASPNSIGKSLSSYPQYCLGHCIVPGCSFHVRVKWVPSQCRTDTWCDLRNWFLLKCQNSDLSTEYMIPIAHRLSYNVERHGSLLLKPATPRRLTTTSFHAFSSIM